MSLPVSQLSPVQPDESISQVDFWPDGDEEYIFEDPTLFESVPPSEVSSQRKLGHDHEQYIRVDEADVEAANAFLKIVRKKKITDF